MASKFLKGVEVLPLGCIFINRRSNRIRFCKGIGKLDSMVQVIYKTLISKLDPVIISHIELANVL